MSLIKWSPFFEPFEGMDKFFDGMPSNPSRSNGLMPAIDVYDSGKSLVVETALPGVNPKDVELSINDGVLTISGKSERKTEVDEKDYYRKEIRSGQFMRQLALPSGVQTENAKASFKDGILKIELDKLEEPKPKTIKIDVK
ncbi:MAG: Hsp20/alpha crystallin family protein [Patescibacteria group bacterium]|nr:Hsp20/alpha crystallin family protein [Candidatus Uhrbacteria bacterium]